MSNKPQKIYLLTRISDFKHIVVERDPEWFEVEDDINILSDDDAILEDPEMGLRESLGDLQLNLTVIILRGQGGDADTWQFSLQHERFPNGPIYEWESDVPAEDIPEVRLECNSIREVKARFAERETLDRMRDEDEEE